MASERLILDDIRRTSGAALLRMADDVGFDALGAGWVLDETAGRWWYLLVSPMIDSKGPRWVYERLLALFAKLHLPEGISPLDIRIASPREEGFRQFPIRVDGTPEGASSATEIRDLLIGTMHISAMYLYRMRPLGQSSGDRARRFDARYRELMAA